MRQNSGYFGLWRKLFASEVWRMTPVYSRVWLWILGNVQWQMYEAKTATKFCIYVLPGQKITSLNDIAHGATWEEWGKEKVPNRKTISTVLEWLQLRGMINAESNNKHTFISVINWHIYQDAVAGEVTEKVTRNGRLMDRATDTNKKENKEKTTTLCPFAEITDLYHRILPTLPKTRLPESIKKQLSARYKNGMGNVAAWENLFNKVSDSAFLMGDNDRGWKADLGWLTNETNMDKVLGGKYEGRDANSKIGRII